MAGQKSPGFLAESEHVRAHAVPGDPLRLSVRHRGLRSGSARWPALLVDVWATVILLVALAVTPAVTIFRSPALIDVRRMIGVTALVYTIAHMVLDLALR